MLRAGPSNVEMSNDGSRSQSMSITASTIGAFGSLKDSRDSFIGASIFSILNIFMALGNPLSRQDYSEKLFVLRGTKESASDLTTPIRFRSRSNGATRTQRGKLDKWGKCDKWGTQPRHLDI